MKIQFCLESYLKDLEEIVNIDSGSWDYEGCGRMIQWFSDRYRQAGFDVVISDEPGKHPMMEARYSTEENACIDLLLMGHLDTVFSKGTVKERPFSIEDGYAKGPGAADMKSGALLALYLAEALAASDLNISLCAVLNSDEEIGSDDSADRIRELGRKAKFCFNFEGGRPGGAFVKQRKGVYDYYFEFNGIAAHAGIEPEKGASAVAEMARFIEAVGKLNAAETGTTLNAGLVQGGTASNVVPDHAEMVVELRYLSEDEKKQIESNFDYLINNPMVLGVKSAWRRGSGFPPMNPNEKTEELMTVMEEAAVVMGQKKPEFAFTGGGSDANHLGNLSIAVMDGCGPEGGLYHSAQEYMVISSVEPRFRLLFATAEKLCKKMI